VAAIAQGLNAHAPAPQVADAANRRVHEKFIAAGMQPAQRGDRQAGIEMIGDRPGKAGAEVHLAASDLLCCTEASGRPHILDIREPFRAQERFGHVRWGGANRRGERQADRGRFGSALFGERASCAENARGAGRGQRREEIAARLHDMHAQPPLGVRRRSPIESLPRAA
jgi:hypothetical protein